MLRPELQEIIGANSLGYLSVEGLMKVVGGSNGGFCDACFTGNYPVPIQLELNKLVLERRAQRDAPGSNGQQPS